MDYERVFCEAVAHVRREDRYRVFADLHRLAGQFPYARYHGPGPESASSYGAQTTTSRKARTPLSSKR